MSSMSVCGWCCCPGRCLRWAVCSVSLMSVWGWPERPEGSRRAVAHGPRSARDSDARCDERPRMGSTHDHLVAWPQAATDHQRGRAGPRSPSRPGARGPQRAERDRRAVARLDCRDQSGAHARRHSRTETPARTSSSSANPRALTFALASETTSLPISASDCSRSLRTCRGRQPRRSHPHQGGAHRTRRRATTERRGACQAIGEVSVVLFTRPRGPPEWHLCNVFTKLGPAPRGSGECTT
jgi:hypothetical protein